MSLADHVGRTSEHPRSWHSPGGPKSGILLKALLCTLILLEQTFGQTNTTYILNGLPRCTQSSLELSRLGTDDSLDPCILYDVDPVMSNNTFQRSTKITLIQVTPASCGNHRDGAVTGVRILNADNDNRGVGIGFNEDYFVSSVFSTL